MTVGAAQPGKGCPQRQKPPVVVHEGVVLLGAVPVQPVQGGRGAVAVPYPLFGAGKLLARLHEGQTEAGQVDARRQPVLCQCHGVPGGELRLFVADAEQLVPQGKVVVGGNVAHDLAGRVGRQTVAAAPCRHRCADIPEAAGLALHIARLPGIEAAALDGVPGVVAEDAHPLVEHGKVRLVGLVPVQLAGTALPRLAVQQDIPPAGQAVQRGAHRVDALGIVQAHQVEPEAVDVVLLRPVEDGVDEVPPRHGALAGKLVAAAAAVGKAAVRVLPEKVVGHGIV